MNKKQVREQFRNAVFSRDNNKCVICGALAVDAHHITNRNFMPNGGYVAENGISLCEECHIKAEECLFDESKHDGYSSDKLYKLIWSSKQKAYESSCLLHG